LRVFDAVKGQQQTGCAGSGRLRRVQVFDGQRLLWVDEGDDALMSGVLGGEGQLLAGFLADTDAALAAEQNELGETGVVTLLGYENVVETPPAGLERFLDRVQAIQDFHRH
jgi:hypothetical protein